ncbi:hypothetical protein Tco_0491822 [Tanacetum coccineum]
MSLIPNKAVHKELGDSLVRVATTASSLEAEHDSGNITKTRSKATPNESSSLGTTSGGGPRCQETMGDTIAQTSLKLKELMALCTTLQTKVLDLEKTKTTQHNEIASLKRRVKNLEMKNRSRTHKLKTLYKVGLIARVESSRDEESLGEDASKQGRINAIDADEEITLVSVQDDADKEIFDVDDLNGEEMFVARQNENVVEEVVDVVQVSTAATTITITTKEITLAQELKALKTSKPKVKWIVFKEPVKFDEEERLAREKAKKEKEANITLIETWDDIQAKIDADHQLAKRLQVQEQEELSIKEKATLFQQLLEKRRKHFAAKRRAGAELIQEITKKQKVEDDKVTAELKQCLEIILGEEESQMYMFFSQMLKSFDRGDLEDMYKLVKAKYKSTRLVEDLDLLLWGNLKTMFEPHVENAVWRNQQGYKVLEWKLYDSCRVHSLMMKHVHIYMLVEKKYPLAPLTLSMKLEKKLKIDYESGMAYQLLKLIIKQLK